MAKVWTAEDEDFLIAHYDEMSNVELAKYYNVTPKAISHKMRRLRDRMKKERKKKEKELEAQRKQQQQQELELEQYFEEEYEPLNLPKIKAFEKCIYVDGSPMDLISTGFFVKTEDGWSPIMMQKDKISNI